MARGPLNAAPRTYGPAAGKNAPSLAAEAPSHTRGELLRRLWAYMGRNRLLIVLAVTLSASSSLLALYGPKLSGTAINAISLGKGRVDFDDAKVKLVMRIESCGREEDVQLIEERSAELRAKENARRNAHDREFTK